MKIASFESLEFLFSKNFRRHFCLTFPGSACNFLTASSYPKGKIVPLDIHSNKIWQDEWKIISKTNLLNLLLERGVGALVLDTHSSASIEKWAKKGNIKLVVTPFKIQKKLENKIFFERFLKKHGLPSPKSWILKSMNDVDSIDIFPAVLQIPDSDGSKGTFFVENKKDVKDLIVSKKIKFPLLCREFVDNALPLGVSVLVGRKNMVFSALRTQAYFQNKGKSIYYGIQWVKTSFFSNKILDKLNFLLNELGQALQDFGFYGVANFDLMLRGDGIYFIECNPRLGGATPQIAFKNVLLHGLDFGFEFSNVCCGKELSSNKPFIPESNYEGFNLDLDFISNLHPGAKINTLEVGFYKPCGQNLSYVSSKKDAFCDASTIFVYHSLPKKVVLSLDLFLGFVMTHNPLLKLNKKGYDFSAKSLEFIKNVENLILRNGANC